MVGKHYLGDWYLRAANLRHRARYFLSSGRLIYPRLSVPNRDGSSAPPKLNGGRGSMCSIMGSAHLLQRGSVGLAVLTS